MKPSDIKFIASYIKELEEALMEFDLDQKAMQIHLTKIESTISQLMDLTAKAHDNKQTLTLLEVKARKCRDCIKRRLIGRN